MKKLTVPYLPGAGTGHDITGISDLLDKLGRHQLDQAPWPAYAYKPAVQFVMAYAHDRLFLKYYVEEQTVRAVYNHANDPVYKDSCVELFISFDRVGYYNLEFNCLGTCLAGFGNGRNDRTLLPEALIHRIKTLAVIDKSSPAGRAAIKWQLTVAVPVSTFLYHPGVLLQHATCYGNLYKCGDELEQPHYLCWNRVDAPEPDFHLPEFFGTIHFAPAPAAGPLPS